MPRINIQDSWWIDPRRSALIKKLGSEEMADGAAVRLWRLGQEYWKHNHQAIPKHCFDLLGCALQLLECGLCYLEEGGIYVRGSCQNFEWLDGKREAASKGGKISATRPRDSRGRLQAVSKQSPSESNRVQRSSSSSSSSSNTQKIKNNIVGIRSIYSKEFNELWEMYGRRGDKKESFREYNHLGLQASELENLKTAIGNYVSENKDIQFRKHFQRFLKTDWRETLKPTLNDTRAAIFDFLPKDPGIELKSL